MLAQPDEEKILSEKLQERFNALPKALQNAITSAEIEKKLRGLSETHKLHLDQWQKLENEVMLALLGFQPVENLEANIKNEVGIAEEEAKAFAGDIADTIFEPIREELERELGKPTDEPVEDKPVAGSPQPVARELNSVSLPPATSYKIQATSSPLQTPAQTIIENVPPRPIEVAAVPPVASTPPSPAPAAKSVRATLSPAYAPDTKSHDRTTIDDDPYREPIA
jgi:hypothetical protein